MENQELTDLTRCLGRPNRRVTDLTRPLAPTTRRGAASAGALPRSPPSKGNCASVLYKLTRMRLNTLMDLPTLRREKPKRLLNFRFPPWHAESLRILAQTRGESQTAAILTLIEYAVQTKPTLPSPRVPKAHPDRQLLR